MPFCMQCGRETCSGEPLCRSCAGKNRPAPYEPGTAARCALMVLCTDRFMRLFKRIKAYAVFFSDQTVIAHLSKEREKAEGRAMLKALKNKEQTLLQNVITRFNMWIYYGERYYDMNVQSILNEDPANFSLQHEEVSGFVFRASQEDAETDDSGSWMGEMLIHTQGRDTVSMNHNYRDTNCRIKGVLSALYGDRLDYRESGMHFGPSGSKAYGNRRFY